MRIPINFVCCCPEDYAPDSDTIDKATKADVSEITISHNPKEAIENADIVYTDVWASMGQKKEASLREKTVSYTHLTLPTTPYV